MPLFDYKCNECGAITEHLVRMDEHPAKCPECNYGDEMVRQIAIPHLSGFAKERIMSRASNPQTMPTKFYFDKNPLAKKKERVKP